MKLNRIPYVGRRMEQAIRRVKLAGYRPEVIEQEEAARWDQAGLDFERARQKFDNARSKLGGKPFDPTRDSIHWILAAAVEQRFRPRRILELGTFTGEFTALLAELYPEAEIVTVDLPETDPLLQGMYGRKKPATLEREMTLRSANLSRSNVTVVKSNSFFLLDAVRGPFDVVWVDAGHKFPDVAWDLCNAFYLVRTGGIVMADDVTRNLEFSSKNLGPDTEIVLSYVAERTEMPVHYFLKRRNEASYLNPPATKHVAWCEKPASWPPRA